MTGFDFASALFSFVLGLALAERSGRVAGFRRHYDQHNRLILSGILAINLFVTVAIDPYAPLPSAAQQAVIDNGGLEIAGIAMIGALLTVVLIFVKNRVLNIIGLALVIAAILTGATSIALNGLTPV